MLCWLIWAVAGWLLRRWGAAAVSEEKMVGLVQGALAARGITDEVVAAGQFNPRGHTGGMFAGGLTGSEAGGLLGGGCPWFFHA